MPISKIFTSHPASVGETYWQHFTFAIKIFISLAKAAFACLIHAVIPSLFENTTSSEIRNLHDGLDKRPVVGSGDDESRVPVGGFQQPLLHGTD